MRFCVNGNQTPRVLKQADEIKLKYKDRNIILDWIEDYPEADFLIDCFYVEEINWEEIQKYNELSRGRIVLVLKTYEDMEIAGQLEIRHYLGWAIQNFYELNAIMSFDPEYIIPGPSLFFMMDALRKFDVGIRIIPNICYNDGLPRESGAEGLWVLPQDLYGAYADYIDAVEFGDCENDKTKEEALLRIYKDEKEWRTSMNVLFTNFNENAVGRLILPEVAEVRLNCGQACMRGGSCRICPNSIWLADPDRLETYKEVTNKTT